MGEVAELVSALLGLFWFGLVGFVAVRYHAPIVQLLKRLKAFRGFGVELDFAKQSLEDAVAANPKFTSQTVDVEASRQFAKVVISPADKLRVLERAADHAALLDGKHILWVDDNPSNNFNERQMFRRLGVTTTAVRNTTEALTRLEIDAPMFDVVISDIRREEEDSGIKFLNQYRKDGNRRPLIFYVGHKEPDKPPPHGAFRLTNRPDELLDFVIDALLTGKDG